jgi:hypothetical protein
MVQLMIQPINDVDSIFTAIYLERKLLVNFLTYSKILDEVGRVACLLMALLRQRVIVL